MWFTDYLKNLSEDSADYKDTQGKVMAFVFRLKISLQPLWLSCKNRASFFFFFYSDALAIVKEVANHANDIMKQGVRACMELTPALLIMYVAHVHLCLSFSNSQDNFQKLIQVQCRLIGNHEIVQPGRVRQVQVQNDDSKFNNHFTESCS